MNSLTKIFLMSIAVAGSAVHAADFLEIIAEPHQQATDDQSHKGEKIHISVKPNAHLSGAYIYLSDVSECTGSERLCFESLGIDLGPAPKPGHFQVLSTKGITARVAAELGAERTEVSGPDDVRIDADYIVINSQAVKEQLVKALEPINRNGGYRIDIIKVRLTGDRKVRPTDYSLHFPALEASGAKDLQWAISQFNGHFGLELAVDSENSGGELLTVQVQGAVWVNVLAAVRDLSPDVALKGDEFEASWRRPHAANLEWINEPSEFAGKSLKRALARGEAATSSMLTKSILVRRGQEIQLLLKSGALVITSRAKALDAGGSGDSIEVQSIETKKKIFARVIDHATVEVLL